MTLRPDGFIGAVMAMEGIVDATALLHGQSGCRKGLLLSNKMCPRPDRIVDVPTYNGCPTVPFSGINQGDYTGKSYQKLRNALEYVSKEDYMFIAVICSPGISIVGDDCLRATREFSGNTPSMVIDNDSLGNEAWEGFDHTMCEALRRMCPPTRNMRRGTAVVTGLSIMQKDWTSVRKEMDHILEHMGLTCICYAGAGCTTSELADSVNAEFCIDLCHEYSPETREFYASRGLTVVSPEHAPVGFYAIREFYIQLGESTGLDVSKPLNMLGRHMQRAYECMVAADTDLRGRRFHVDAPPSIKLPLIEFVERSFAMIHSEGRYDILFADGNRCRMEAASGKCAKCIDLGFPSNKVDFNRNPVLGLNGTMYLLDRLFE